MSALGVEYERAFKWLLALLIVGGVAWATFITTQLYGIAADVRVLAAVAADVREANLGALSTRVQRNESEINDLRRRMDGERPWRQ